MIVLFYSCQFMFEMQFEMKTSFILKGPLAQLYIKKLLVRVLDFNIYLIYKYKYFMGKNTITIIGNGPTYV